jgi:two-component system sensor histidine kinase DesK
VEAIPIAAGARDVRLLATLRTIGVGEPPSIAEMASDLDLPGTEARLRRARIATLASLVGAVLTSLVFPAIGLLSEPAVLWIVLGALGILAFSGTQAGALYSAVTPWLTETSRRRLVVAFGVASLISIPLVGPVGDEDWEAWAWLGGSIVGSAPLLVGRRAATIVIAAAIAVSVGVAWSTDGSAGAYVFITAGIGLMVAAMCSLPMWLWGLLVHAQSRRAAEGRLAAAEERLRFARDVHDLLGHNLSVIALKAELAARLATVDPGRAAREATEVQRLAASALTDVRQAVHGYRAVDLHEQLSAIEQVLASSGVRCTVTQPAGELPAEIATELAAVVREASTNVLRHSRASWCAIELARRGSEVRLTVANDGAADAAPDRYSYGLRGLAQRLGDAGGVLHTQTSDGIFTLEAIIPAAP